MNRVLSFLSAYIICISNDNNTNFILKMRSTKKPIQSHKIFLKFYLLKILFFFMKVFYPSLQI